MPDAHARPQRPSARRQILPWPRIGGRGGEEADAASLLPPSRPGRARQEAVPPLGMPLGMIVAAILAALAFAPVVRGITAGLTQTADALLPVAVPYALPPR